MTEEQIKKRLLKKRRCILTKCTKIVNDGYVRKYMRGNTHVNVNCELNKDWYLGQIEKAKKIIAKLG